jgi:hypothetical protein
MVFWMGAGGVGGVVSGGVGVGDVGDGVGGDSCAFEIKCGCWPVRGVS